VFLQSPEQGGEASKNIQHRGDPNWGCVISSLSACCMGTSHDTRVLLTLKTNLLPEIIHTIFLVCCLGMGCKVFTKLTFRSRSKKFGNRWTRG